MRPQTIDWLAGFAEPVREQIARLRELGVLEQRLLERYPDRHDIQSNAALYAYVQELKREHLKSSPPLGKVRYSEKIGVLYQALGLHTYAVRVQGKNLKRKHELRVAGLFRDLPPEFLRMVVVHELAHLRHKEHDRAFYRLCEHIEPEYIRYETDLRLLMYAREG